MADLQTAKSGGGRHVFSMHFKTWTWSSKREPKIKLEVQKRKGAAKAALGGQNDSQSWWDPGCTEQLSKEELGAISEPLLFLAGTIILGFKKKWVKKYSLSKKKSLGKVANTNQNSLEKHFALVNHGTKKVSEAVCPSEKIPGCARGFLLFHTGCFSIFRNRAPGVYLHLEPCFMGIFHLCPTAFLVWLLSKLASYHTTCTDPSELDCPL